MNELIKRLCALLSIKSIITVAATIVFVVLALTGVLSGAEFLNVFLIIVGFYFGCQANK